MKRNIDLDEDKEAEKMMLSKIGQMELEEPEQMKIFEEVKVPPTYSTENVSQNVSSLVKIEFDVSEHEKICSKKKKKVLKRKSYKPPGRKAVNPEMEL